MLSWILIGLGAWLAFDLVVVAFLVTLAEGRRWAACRALRRRRRARAGYLGDRPAGDYVERGAWW